MKGIAILGSTGSIGTNTLRVVERLADRFSVVGLAAGTRVDELSEQVTRFRPKVVSIQSEDDAGALRTRFGGVAVGSGIQGMVDVATHPEVDVVVSATVGAIGLIPTLRALEAGSE